MTFSLLFYCVAIPAVLLTGISKGGLGGALGGIAVPLMALVISPRLAAAILLPILCLIDVVGFRVYFKKWDNRIVRLMIPGTLFGIALGALSFGILSTAATRLMLGVITISFVIWKGLAQALNNRAINQANINPANITPNLNPKRGVLLAALSGFTSFVAHAGGPPVTIYLLSQRLSVTTFVATTNVVFLITNAIKLIPYFYLGQFTTESLWVSLTLAPLVPIGVYAGLWLQNRINQIWFFRIAQIGLLVTGVVLLGQGLGWIK